MRRVSSIFSQILQLFPRGEFEQLASRHGTERYAKGFSSWGQFIGMLFCQLGQVTLAGDLRTPGRIREAGRPSGDGAHGRCLR